jgi:hypothetical protein
MEPPSASDPAVIAQWSEIIALPNVPIRAHLTSIDYTFSGPQPPLWWAFA